VLFRSKNIPCGLNIPFFGKGFDHPRMWAQYAVNEGGIDNKGICLCINKISLIKELKKINNIYKILHKRIKYVPYLFYKTNSKSLSAYRLDKRDIKKDIIETAKQKALEGYDYLFFRKLSDWQNENEYRFICLCNDEKKISIELNKILKAVIVGYKNDIDNKLIIEYCHKSNIPIYYPQYSYGHIEELFEYEI
jgi:hypothetical protein